MEAQNSVAKQSSLDGKGTLAGTVEPTPEKSDSDTLAKDAGVSIEIGEEIGIKEMLDERDRDRWALNPDSQPRLK